MTTAPISLFWYWVDERHRIYLRRQAGEPKPWSEDEIFQTYKFTNVFRQLDRGTIWLTDNFIEPHWDDNPALLAFNCAWYRMFNWTGTGQLLGWRRRWRTRDIIRILTRAQAAGRQIFTGAHIVWAEGGKPKIDGVVEICAELFGRRRHIYSMSRYTRSLEGVFDYLCEVRGLGGFMAYEIVSDLRHTPLLEDARDINTWANVGPGAFRGLRRIWPDLRYQDALGKMIELLEMSRQPGVLEDHVPPLELRDIEHVSCEWDKWCRVKFGEGKPRSKYPGAADA